MAVLLITHGIVSPATITIWLRLFQAALLVLRQGTGQPQAGYFASRLGKRELYGKLYSTDKVFY